MNQDIFRAYDIRGVAGTDLTEKVVVDIGKALGSLIINQEDSEIIVGRDSRLSSPKLFSYLNEFINTSDNLEKVNLDIENNFLEKINKFASIKHISENVKKDENKLFEIFKEMKRDLKNIALEMKINDLESKFSKDLSENTFNKIIELKKLQNTN